MHLDLETQAVQDRHRHKLDQGAKVRGAVAADEALAYVALRVLREERKRLVKESADVDRRNASGAIEVREECFAEIRLVYRCTLAIAEQLMIRSAAQGCILPVSPGQTPGTFGRPLNPFTEVMLGRRSADRH